MKKNYTILLLVILAFGCKLKQDKQADTQQKLPDNSSALNSKASNNVTGWEKLNTVDAGGNTNAMSQQMEALNSTEEGKKYLADSMDRMRNIPKDISAQNKPQETVVRQVNTAPVKEAVKRPSNSGVRRGKPVERVVPTTPAIVAEKPTTAPLIDKADNDNAGDVDDFNTVVFRKKTTLQKEPAGNDKEPVAAYTGKERFDQVDVSIPAVVFEKTTVATGGALSVKTTKSMYIGQGITLPAGSKVTGFADIQDDRLNLIIRSINYNGRILRLAWKVYDEDGAEGIAISNATLKKNGSSGVNQTLNAAGQILTGSSRLGQLSGGMVRSVLSGSGKISIAIDQGKKLIIKSSN